MKRIIAILLTVLLLGMLTACDQNVGRHADGIIKADKATFDIGKTHSSFEGMTIQIANAIWDDEEIKLDVNWINKTGYDVVYGSSYDIERENNGEWSSCVTLEDLAFTSIGYELKAGATQKKTYNLTDVEISKILSWLVPFSGLEYLFLPKTCSSESRNSLSQDFTHVLSHGVSCSIEIGSIDSSRSSESCFASLPLRNARIVLLSHPPAFVASRFMGNCSFRQFSNMKNILPAWSCVTRIVFSSPFASRIGISVFSFF